MLLALRSLYDTPPQLGARALVFTAPGKRAVVMVESEEVVSTRTLRIVRGDSLIEGKAQWQLLVGGTPQSLAGATVRWERRHLQAAVSVAEESRGMTVLDEDLGKVTIAYTPEQSLELQLGQHIVQIEVTYDDDTVETWEGTTLQVVEGLAPSY